MCGIIGAWLRHGDHSTLSPAVLAGMDSMLHRGPDDRGHACIQPRSNEASVVFGHQRLSIIDLSEGGHQPMFDTESGNWIVYNGEVFNFADLRAELEEFGCRFRSNSDTEVILQSYRKWGRDCVKKWRGMFALAIWDAGANEIFLVRDRLGIKPLYYYYKDGDFIFASELRALIKTGLISIQISPAAVETYLMFGSVQDPLTLVKGVMSLPPAHSLTVREHAIELKEYWDIPLNAGAANDRQEERVSELLADSVRLRLISDVPVGVFLSGGVDSSALAMLMRGTSPDQVRAFTIGVEQEELDESVQARETAKLLGIEHNIIRLTEGEMLASCDDAINTLDQPSMDGINTYHVSRAVKQAGITVALSGLGGDEVFCGYSHFRTVPRMSNFQKGWAKLPDRIRKAVASLVGSSGHNKPKLSAFLTNGFGFSNPYFLLRSLFLPAQITELLHPGIDGAVHGGEWQERIRVITERASKLDPINAVSYLELKNYLPNTLLRDTDATSMAHSLEVRVPFLDHLLLEEVLKMPGDVKLTRSIPKPLLLRSLPEKLPDGVTKTKKRGFVLPFAKWMPNQLRSRIEECFSNQPSGLTGIIDGTAVRDVWLSFLRGECSWTRPWSLYVLYKTVPELFRDAGRAGAP